MKKIKSFIIAVTNLIMVGGAVLYFNVSPAMAQDLQSFNGDRNFTWNAPKWEANKKTVFILAENEGTELFDLMAPFYLFNATGKANVYIVSEKKAPVLLFNSLFILPHYTYAEIDALHMAPDVVVIPNITLHLMSPPKMTTVNWIKKQVGASTLVLSICDGSATAAATGLYDGKPLTTHASDLAKVKKKFPKPLWVKNVSVTENGNLYSTAGVSNAVDGSLTVIKRMFGEETMNTVLQGVSYPHSSVKLEHNSEVVKMGEIIRVITKKLFRKNYKIGVLLSDDVNEFTLASILDTYVRSFPSSIKSMSVTGGKVTSKYGLTMYPTSTISTHKLDEVHVINNLMDKELFPRATIVSYDQQGKYPIETCLDRIRMQYGDKFRHTVKLMLDYN